MVTREELELMYGKDIQVTQKDAFTLVHLDKPSADLMELRTETFDPETFFACGCPVCALTRESGIIVFDDSQFIADEAQIV